MAIGARAERRSAELAAEALRLMPGGVSSPVRAMRSVGRDHPLFIARGEGGWVRDADGNRYVDWVMSWGPLIAGHAHPAVVEAVRDAAGRGTSFGAPTELELELARELVAAVPTLEQVRFVSSGTEAAMSAIRLARGFTGRDRIIKFAGGYHGHADALLARAGSGMATLSIPSSPGVPAAAAADTLVVEYNDLEGVRAVAERHADQLAAVVVEPVAGNMGVVAPEPGFLEGLRTICNGAGALLVADEVITGFRVGYGGAQERLAVRPDLTCLGKVVGGGLPAAAFGGRSDVMQHLAPAGDVYQAGTLSGNPLAMAAGLATLRILREPGAYDRLEQVGAALERALAGPGVTVNRVGAMLTGFFHPGPVRSYADAAASDTDRFAAFHRHMLERGVYLAPSQFEAAMPSLAHTDEQLELTAAAAAEFQA
ncbi:MAG TPA: glutamate-1-semialdehyde 2,1-aminomutase [Gaiellales bacterium]|jgi:glutamate-1-semialdehyde 2,1-aminomutase|nr:glutamate-1-semialdehyde 2,1-aminomutase [Gaiellales bacterium]